MKKKGIMSKIMAVILAASMMVGYMPVSALADENEVIVDSEEASPSEPEGEEEVAYSAEASLQDGVLAITLTGATLEDLENPVYSLDYEEDGEEVNLCSGNLEALSFTVDPAPVTGTAYTLTISCDNAEDVSVDVTAAGVVDLSSVTIGGISYYYAKTTDGTGVTYRATVRSRQGETTYDFTLDDMTQVGDSDYYYVTLDGVTPLSGNLYALTDGSESSYAEEYAKLGVNTDDSYDAISSATAYSSVHAKDISSVVTYGTDADGNKAITGLELGRGSDIVDADAYVEAMILNAAGEELTDDQKTLTEVTLKQNPTQAPAEETITPAVASATYAATSSYGLGEFDIVPDDTVEGYVWSEYWDNVYAATVSDGSTTVGAVHWIDLYGEYSTSGYHYNKIQLALNNGVSVGKNQATVDRFAAFYNEDNELYAGTYTITIYADGYEPMEAQIEVAAGTDGVTEKVAMASTTIGGISYYYCQAADTENATYVATVRSRAGSTNYEYKLDELTALGDTGYYYTTLDTEALSGSLYTIEEGTASTYADEYAKLGVKTDDSYDAISSATAYSSVHAKDISSVVTYGTDSDGNKAITGLELGRGSSSVDADAYVEAMILNAAGEELTDDQKTLTEVTLKQNPTEAPAEDAVTPVAASATYTSSSQYGLGEFDIVPDDTVEGYVWSEYWDNVYAATVSDGSTTVGAVHWIDLYGEYSTSGYHYNKIQLALNNGVSVGKNQATVDRFAAFYNSNNELKAGDYTITIYADGYAPMSTTVTVSADTEGVAAVETMSSVSIGGVSYYYVKDAVEGTIYRASVRSRMGTTNYDYELSDLTQVGDSDYYYVTLDGVTPLSGNLYALTDGSESSYAEEYAKLGVNTDDSYDAISSATAYSSVHAKDISSVVTYGTDADGNKAITGLELGRGSDIVDADAYVEAMILNAAGEDLTDDQKTLTEVTLKQNPTEAPAEETVAPIVKSATYTSSSQYGLGEFDIVPYDNVKGYVWSEYWDNVYAATISDGTTTVGAVHWIDLYGEYSTSGYHYNKIQLALNNDESVGKNKATVNRYAAFFNENNELYAGDYTITIYAEGYEPMQTTVNVSADNEGVAKRAQTVSVETKSYTKSYGDTFTLDGITASQGGKLVYISNNTDIVNVGITSGEVKLKGIGKATITVYAMETDSAQAASQKITITVNKAAQKLTVKALSKKTLSYSTLKKKALTVKVISSVTGKKGTLTYKKTSGNSGITVNKSTGKITVKKGMKKGTYTIKIKVIASATSLYNQGTKTISMKVVVK